MNTIPDLTERKIALNPEKSFIVQAPAGSGKTALLTQRFLVLLSRANKHPEEILALTFTNKAVSEMRNRIIEALMRGEDDTPPKESYDQTTWNLARIVLARDKVENWHLLENPNRLRIQTLDSFCSRLTRQLPLSAEFGAPPAMTDNPSKLYQLAIRTLLSDIEKAYPWSNAIETLLLHLDNNMPKLEGLLTELLSRRDQWLYYLLHGNDPKQQRIIFEKSLKNSINDHVKTLKSLFPDTGSPLMMEALQCVHQYSHIISEDNKILLSSHDDELSYWQSIATLLLTKKDEWRKIFDKKLGFPTGLTDKNEKMFIKSLKERLKTFLNSLEDDNILKQSLAKTLHLPSPTYTEKQWNILSALVTLLPVLVQQLRLVFSETGTMDYVENAQAALQALSVEDAPTDLALRLDYSISHILMDEFQDTSLSQFRLLTQLTQNWLPDEGKTLFIVGDPMQSIYRFREAEVGLFLHAKEHGINHLTLNPLTLKANFRSRPSIIQWINQHFEQAFPKENQVTTGAISYNQATAMKAEDHRAGVTIHPFTQAHELAESERIIKIIQTTEKNQSIAILVRTKTQLAYILPALRSANIAYKAVDIDILATRPVIMDLMSLTKALLHLGDRIAWLALLRSPLCGLLLHDLYQLASDKNKTLYEQINSPAITKTFNSDSQLRLEYITRHINRRLRDRSRLSLRQWIETIWHDLHGPVCYATDSDFSDSNTFFQLLSTLDEGADIKDFTELDRRVMRLFATPADEQTNVQIMTIHKAKGLEFDAVILPSLQKTTRATQKSLFNWLEVTRDDGQTECLIAPIQAVGDPIDKIYHYIRQQEAEKIQHETTRLLYVACTRAKTHLHLLAEVKLNADNTLKAPPSQSFLAKLMPSLQSLFQTEAEKQNSVVTGQQNTDAEKIILLKRLPLEYFQKTELVETRTTTHRQKRATPSKTPAIIGATTHKILENMGNFGIVWWENHPAPDEHIHDLLTKNNILPTERNQAFNTVFSAIKHTVGDPQGRWILGAHKEARCEYALSTLIDEHVVNLIIDRTFIDEKGDRWIIDYKIIQTDIKNQENFLTKQTQYYQTQLQQYKHAVDTLCTEPVRTALYFPLQSLFITSPLAGEASYELETTLHEETSKSPPP